MYKRQLLEAVENNHYYNKEKNVGAEVINGRFFLYTNTGEYVLYESSTGKYYKFGNAKIGIPLVYSDKGISWKPPLVINRYSHPGIPDKNRPMQEICNGPFSYDRLRKEYPSVKTQLCILLNKVRDMILRGYFGNQGAWHPLTQEDYWASHEIKESFDRSLVSNV